MAFLIKIVLVLALAVAAITLLGQGPGYVLVQVGPWVLETTAALAALGILVILAVGWEVWGLLSATWGVPKRIAESRAQRRQRRSLELLQEGVLALERGEAKQAQRLLAQGAGFAEAPSAFYVEAARAAHSAGRPDQAESYLDRIQDQADQGDERDPAITLLRAEIEMDGGRREHALALLADLEHRERENPRVIERLLQLYRGLEDFEAILRILPRARKAGVLAAEEEQEIDRAVRGRALEQARLEGDEKLAERLWKAADRGGRADRRLVGPRVRFLLGRGLGDEAQKTLEQALRRNWQGELVELFLALPEAPGSARSFLERLEGWREDHPGDPHLLTVLAQLAISAQYWGKADQYLEEASAQESLPPELLLRIAHLLRERGKTEDALACCQRGLAALDCRSEVSLLPAAPSPGG